MAISEHDRFELHRALERALGVDQAATLMEHLPPVGWADVATKRDLEALSAGLRNQLAVFGSELRTELYRALNEQTLRMVEQTRVLFFAMVGTMVTLAALAFGAARLGA